MADTADNAELETFRREVVQRIERHVTESKCRLNPDTRMVAALIEGLVRRKAKSGDYYCPCRIVTGNLETDAANVCACRTHMDEIAETGKCHCGLFVGDKVS